VAVLATPVPAVLLAVVVVVVVSSIWFSRGVVVERLRATVEELSDLLNSSFLVT
jgi:hypothetical protein